MRLELPEQPKAEHGIGRVYIGSCCVCGVTVMTDGDLYPKGPSIALCTDEYEKCRQSPELRFIYCMTCKKATFELGFDEKDAHRLPDMVLFTEDCPKCNPKFTQFTLRRWNEL